METSPRRITTQALQLMAPSDRSQRYKSAILETCAQHGEYPSFLLQSGWSACVQCEHAVENASAAAAHASWQAELRSRAWEARLGRAAIPERFLDRRLETYEPTCEAAEKALRVATRYAANFATARKAGTCLIFCGTIGTGKTHLAVGIAHQVLEQGGQAVFTSVMRAVRSVKETYAKGSTRTEAQAIADLVSPDLLIIDEVGVQHGSDTERLVLFEVINGRYEACRPTIVLSNLAIKLLEEYLGARAFDRLREGGGQLVVCDWESYRSRRAA